MTSLLTSPILAVLVPLIDDAPTAEEVTPGWVYPLVFFSLLAVTILLWLSMRKQLKKIRFPEESADQADRPDDGEPGSDRPTR